MATSLRAGGRLKTRISVLLQRGGGVVVTSIFGLAMSGCGAAAVPGALASGARQSTPSPSAAGYTAYVNAEVMYSLTYPSSWYELPTSRDGSHYGKDFVNEKVGSPSQLSPNGIWLNVQVDLQPSQPCSGPATLAPSVTKRNVTVDGVAGTQYLSASGAAGPYALHNGWCYTFRFLATSAQDINQHLSEVDSILGSFKFNR